MKVTDFNEIRNAAIDYLAENGSAVLDLMSAQEAAMCVTMIYLANDSLTAIGQDFDYGVSIVASRTRISVIGIGNSSYYKSDEPICAYEDLADDVHQIFLMLDVAIDRWLYALPTLGNV